VSMVVDFHLPGGLAQLLNWHDEIEKASGT
jgi:hypothetical protein